MKRFALLAAAAVLAAGPALAPGQAEAETVKIGISKILAYGNVPIAKEKGYFKAEGIDAELVFFDSAQPIAVAVVSGDTDFGIAGLTAGFYSLAGQGAMKIIAGSSQEVPGFHSLAFLASNKAWDSGMTTLKDLPGHTVAITQIGTPLHYALARVAQKLGFDLKSVRVLALQSNTNVKSALVGGQVDASTFPVTPATPLIAQGKVKLLAWLSDAVPGLSGAALFTSTKNANDHRDLVVRFLRAYGKAAHDFHDAFAGPDGKRRDGPMAPEILNILAKFASISVEQAKLGIPYMEPQARLDEEGILQQIEWYKSANFLKGSVDGEKIIDKRYVVTLPKG
jgi:NitT/TauT family transport system substrate-binding protein